jgi:hypothetical protein
LGDFVEINVIKGIEIEMGRKRGLNKRLKGLLPVFAYLGDFDMVGGNS